VSPQVLLRHFQWQVIVQYRKELNVTCQIVNGSRICHWGLDDNAREFCFAVDVAETQSYGSRPIALGNVKKEYPIDTETVSNELEDSGKVMEG
jgi:hypothetical protein